MTVIRKNPTKKSPPFILLFGFVFVTLSMLVACGPLADDLAAIDYAPLPGDDWQISTPDEQGLDPYLVAELFYNAQLETNYSLLVSKNDRLIAEDYFNKGSAVLQVNIYSVTKSITLALVGIAIEESCITSLDQKMMEFFPKRRAQITDPRKNQIAIQQLLQMRAGYPW